MGRHFRSPSQATTSSMASFAGMSKGERCRAKARKRCKSFGHFVYNKENKTFCHRTCKNWFLILTFYFIFLLILVGSFVASLYGIMTYIKRNWHEPYLDKKELMPKSSPGINIIPRISTGSPVIWYTQSGTNSPDNLRPEAYITYLDNYFKQYDIANSSKYVDCEKTVPRKGQHCRFRKEDLGPCGESGYGYKINKPCIYIKMNKLKGWVPNSFTPPGEGKPSKHMVWANCIGKSGFDKDHIGMLRYYPQPGFMWYFFPFDGSKDYLSPLVGVQLNSLTAGFVINIQCSISGRDISTREEISGANTFVYIDIKKN